MRLAARAPAIVASVPVTVRWSGSVPWAMTAAGCPARAPGVDQRARRSASSGAPPCRRRASPGRRRARPSRAPSAPCRDPRARSRSATALAIPRCVTGMPAYAAAATPAVTPGTTSKAIPAARSASASSPPRPNTNGSPPFRRTTLRARARALDHQLPRSRSCGTDGAAALLADVAAARRPRARRRALLRADQAVVEDHVGGRDQLERADREQPRVAGSRADERDPPWARSAGAATRAISSARASSSLGARTRAAARRRARRAPAGSESAVQLVADPVRAVGRADERAQRERARRASRGASAPSGVWQPAPSRARARARRPARARLRRRAAPATAAATRCVARRAPRARACPGPARARALVERAAGSTRGRAAASPARASTIASKSPSSASRAGACRRCRAARTHVEVLAQRAQLRRAAQAARARRARPAPAPQTSRAAERVARRPRAPARRAARARPRARPERPWPSAPRGRPRRPASASSISSTQRDLSAASPRSPLVTISTISAPPERRGDDRACASASGLPRVPSRSALPGGAAALTAARTSARSAPGAGARRPLLLAQREQLAQQLDASVAALRVEARETDRRLVQQPLIDRARDRLDAREVARRRRLPAAGVLLQHALDDLVAVAAQRAIVGQRVELPEPAREAVDLLLDDLVRSGRLARRGLRGCARRPPGGRRCRAA